MSSRILVSWPGRTSVLLTANSSRGSVLARVIRICGDIGKFAALAAQHGLPEPDRVGGERVGRLAGYDIPGTLVDLGLQLARRPAGVARVYPQPGDRIGQQAGRGVQVHQA